MRLNDNDTVASIGIIPHEEEEAAEAEDDAKPATKE